MTPEQEIRAAAIQAAAAFCAPIGYVQGGKIASPEDVLLTADVFCGYIEGGWELALHINATGDKNQAADEPEGEQPDELQNPVEDVELREQRPAENVSMTFDPDPVTIPRATPETPPAPRPAVAVASSTERESEPPTADVIPLAARGTVSATQNKARRRIENMRFARAQKIVDQAKTAKVPLHKQRLLDEAEEAGLGDLQMEIDGRLQELGAYLASL